MSHRDLACVCSRRCRRILHLADIFSAVGQSHGKYRFQHSTFAGRRSKFSHLFLFTFDNHKIYNMSSAESTCTPRRSNTPLMDSLRFAPPAAEPYINIPSTTREHQRDLGLASFCSKEEGAKGSVNAAQREQASRWLASQKT
jgi:hypothetical protein